MLVAVTRGCEGLETVAQVHAGADAAGASGERGGRHAGRAGHAGRAPGADCQRGLVAAGATCNPIPYVQLVCMLVNQNGGKHVAAWACWPLMVQAVVLM